MQPLIPFLPSGTPGPGSPQGGASDAAADLVNAANFLLAVRGEGLPEEQPAEDASGDAGNDPSEEDLSGLSEDGATSEGNAGPEADDLILPEGVPNEIEGLSAEQGSPPSPESAAKPETSEPNAGFVGSDVNSAGIVDASDLPFPPAATGKDRHDLAIPSASAKNVRDAVTPKGESLPASTTQVTSKTVPLSPGGTVKSHAETPARLLAADRGEAVAKIGSAQRQVENAAASSQHTAATSLPGSIHSVKLSQGALPDQVASEAHWPTQFRRHDPGSALTKTSRKMDFIARPTGKDPGAAVVTMPSPQFNHGAAYGFHAALTSDFIAEAQSLSGVDSARAALPAPATNATSLPSAVSVADLPAEIIARIRDLSSNPPPPDMQRRTQITLSPAELGRVTFVIGQEDGVLGLQILVERSETLELVRRHLDLLERTASDGPVRLRLDQEGAANHPGSNRERQLQQNGSGGRAPLRDDNAREQTASEDTLQNDLESATATQSGRLDLRL